MKRRFFTPRPARQAMVRADSQGMLVLSPLARFQERVRAHVSGMQSLAAPPGESGNSSPLASPGGAAVSGADDAA